MENSLEEALLKIKKKVFKKPDDGEQKKVTGGGGTKGISKNANYNNKKEQNRF